MTGVPAGSELDVGCSMLDVLVAAVPRCDLLAQRFVAFRLSGFNHNDQAPLRTCGATCAPAIWWCATWAISGSPMCAALPWREGQPTAAPPVSLLKLAGLVGDFFLILCLEALHCRITDASWRQLNYHGRYERRTRKHFVQTFMK